MWIFGYGSLIWKVDFPIKRQVVGHIRGYVRRFYQHSIDHRGLPHKPGRVVTLIPGDENDTVWGTAYEICEEDIEVVSNHLDFREKNGYTKTSVKFYPNLDSDLHPFELIIYVATPDNVSFAGEADIETIAKQIVSCSGPSGTNKEYVYRLAAAMRSIAPSIIDSHLFDLEKAVQNLDQDLIN
ncbi:putative glutathione-specific gamma-glutamylcyclotransferase 2 [Arctopsyche grandis]|uniref:putative glutathione-specific gamma-glutamylcyclotransferase 2 n=1 Tax=Arctopsyche grandis TaxID=121162 RepID=UPI00406D8273